MRCFFNYCSCYKAREGSFKGRSMPQSDWRLARLYIRRLDVKIVGACAGRGSLWSGRLGPPAGSGAWLMAEPYVNQHPPSLPLKNTSRWSRSENWERNTHVPPPCLSYPLLSSPPPSIAALSFLTLSLSSSRHWLLAIFLPLFVPFILLSSQGRGKAQHSRVHLYYRPSIYPQTVTEVVERSSSCLPML